MKPVKNIHVWLVVLAFVITLGTLFGGQAIAKKFKTTNPLKKEFSKIKAIKSYSVDQEDTGINVNLKLAKVDNLQRVLDKVAERVKFYYHKPVKSFTITNYSNKQLEEARYQLLFNLEEAMLTGRYTQLKNALNSYHNLQAKVYFSANFIYLQMDDGKYYHYEAFARPVRLNGDNTQFGGNTG